MANNDNVWCSPTFRAMTCNLAWRIAKECRKENESSILFLYGYWRECMVLMTVTRPQQVEEEKTYPAFLRS